MSNEELIKAEHLIEFQTFTTPLDDDRDRVVLRVRTLEGGETWYQMPRSSFINLASCLASDAERLRPRQ
jgi:hypothetical protein